MAMIYHKYFTFRNEKETQLRLIVSVSWPHCAWDYIVYRWEKIVFRVQWTENEASIFHKKAVDILSRNTKSKCGQNSVSIHWCWIKPHRASGEVERNVFIDWFARQRVPQWAKALKTVCPSLERERVMRNLTEFEEQDVTSFLMFFWFVGGEVIGSQHHQPSDSS